MSKDLQEISVRLPRAAYADLAAAARHANALDAVSECVANIGITAEIRSYVRALADKLHIEELEARQLLYGLLNLHYLRADLDLTGEQLIEVMTRTIQASAVEEWKAQNLLNWTENSGRLAEALTKTNPIALLQKARHLQYAHQNTLRRCNIVPDIRPVFDDDADEILSGFVTHVLMVEYLEGTQLRRIHFALDTSDVAHLKEQCGRAERKAATAEGLLGELWHRD